MSLQQAELLQGLFELAQFARHLKIDCDRFDIVDQSGAYMLRMTYFKGGMKSQVTVLSDDSLDGLLGYISEFMETTSSLLHTRLFIMAKEEAF